jgi:hypothetical protein
MRNPSPKVMAMAPISRSQFNPANDRSMYRMNSASKIEIRSVPTQSIYLEAQSCLLVESFSLQVEVQGNDLPWDHFSSFSSVRKQAFKSNSFPSLGFPS